MRKSKSLPQKTVKRYRSVSQRRMTDHDNDDSPQEMERLRRVLAQSQAVLEQQQAKQDDKATQNDTERKNASADHNSMTTATTNPYEGILAQELVSNEYGASNDELMILTSKKKKQQHKKRKVELTAEEVRHAKQVEKQTRRKLQQLERRKHQTEQRRVVYDKLQQTQLSASQRALLQPSSALGQARSKRQQLRHLLQRERAGLTLTDDEKALLYKETTTTRHQPMESAGDKDDDNDSVREDHVVEDETQPAPKKAKIQHRLNGSNDDSRASDAKAPPDATETTTTASPTPPLSKKDKKRNKKKRKKNEDDKEDADCGVESGKESGPADKMAHQDNESCTRQSLETNKAETADVGEEVPKSESKSALKVETLRSVKSKGEHRRNDVTQQSTKNGENMAETSGESTSEKLSETTQASASDSNKPPPSFAEQMMASLTSLKASSTKQAEQVAQQKKQQEEQQQLEDQAQQQNAFAAYKDYTPATPHTFQAPSASGVKRLETKRRVIDVPKRPESIQVARYELPVAAMEFELMDTIRNNDVSIICSETGSGKSTQVPQFLYEAGLTLSSTAKSQNNGGGASKTTDDNKDHFMIGITQPRRVAAVSTAKRVCYELGEGDGQSIRGGKKSKTGNLVAYHTRYETAGLGQSTHIKFMTDGILLQEIQSDLLLRKYSVICIDEAHERNLNSDALIGLLSAAIPLRKQAAAEAGSSLPPLKLVIMSATLRVTDFTENPRLFANQPPAVLKIPGRTFPVTIHHSKTTEIEGYEDVAFQKIFKIHRKLPQGGVLVFLTGKQEIVRMVRRLKRALSTTREDTSNDADDSCRRDVAPMENEDNEAFVRDMDDDEVDGDLFVEKEEEDSSEPKMDNEDVVPPNPEASHKDSSIPEKALVLPLYSMLSAEEQAKVFQDVPEGHRLIVIATNIAETSITIPGISYVVDAGRQKCRNYHAGTGVASYDIMWISKAAADQRAGRAGRTGPGHCYRLYSSSMYGRHMDAFALPEVLTRPLEDVVLAMKAMNITNVADFPFPTPPGKEQLGSAIKLLANLGCIDISKTEQRRDDGHITKLGSAVAKLPLGVRYSKMLLVAAEAGVLDYAIAMVAVLSEASPFVVDGQLVDATSDSKDGEESSDGESDEEPKQQDASKKKRRSRWSHRGGDVLAGMLAVGAYSYAGRGAGGVSEKMACRKFCESNGLHPVTMARIQKMRIHLARLAKTRLSKAEGFAAKTGGILSSMKPPNKAQEQLLSQAIASGLLDNVAMLAPLGSIPGEYSFSLRSAYLSCSPNLTEPLLMDRNSVCFSRDTRQLPKFICYDSILRKTTKDGNPVVTLKNVTPIDASWLGSLAKGSSLLKLGEPLPTPLPTYDEEKDAILCSVQTKYGSHGWEIPPVRVDMYDVLQSPESKSSSHFLSDDSFRWFARYLLEGKVLPELKDLSSLLNDSPSLLTRRTPTSKAALLVAALASAGVDSAAALRKHWAQKDHKFLYSQLEKWVRPDSVDKAKTLWMEAVKRNTKVWKKRGRPTS